MVTQAAPEEVYPEAHVEHEEPVYPVAHTEHVPSELYELQLGMVAGGGGGGEVGVGLQLVKSANSIP